MELNPIKITLYLKQNKTIIEETVNPSTIIKTFFSDLSLNNDKFDSLDIISCYKNSKKLNENLSFAQNNIQNSDIILLEVKKRKIKQSDSFQEEIEKSNKNGDKDDNKNESNIKNELNKNIIKDREKYPYTRRNLLPPILKRPRSSRNIFITNTRKEMKGKEDNNFNINNFNDQNFIKDQITKIKKWCF